MTKATFIRITTLIVVLALMITFADFNPEWYKNIMLAVGGWQLGAWASDLGNWLVRKLK
jgi:hypothetical protein